MKKVLVSGYLGFGNFGDEALLYVLIKHLLELGIQRNNITIISNKPNITGNIYNVNAVNRWNFFEVLNALLSHNKLIFIGGVFQDRTSFKSFFYYFLQLFFSGLFGKEVTFFGAGVGPFQRKISQNLFNYGMKNVTWVTVRDQSSAEYIHYKNNVLVTCDPVWGIDVDYSFQNLIKEINWQLPTLGVSIRNDKYLKSHHILNFADKLSRIINGMKDWQVVLIPCMPEEDSPILYELQDLIIKKVSEPNRVIMLETFPYLSIPQQVGVLASCDAVLGMRYHALLVPLSNEKPVFGLIYDQKVKSLLNFASQVGIGFKDDMDQPWNYFWQNMQHSTDKAKLAKKKAYELNKRNLEMLKKFLT